MFVQVIEGTTSDPAALVEEGDRWQRDVRPGAVGYLGVTAGVTADGRALAIVRFEDEASARANAERPEQTAWFEGMAKLYGGEPTFTESSDVTEWMGGGSNDAGFVQVMKSTGVDRLRWRGWTRRSSRSPANGPICSAACASGQAGLLHRRRLLHNGGGGTQGRAGRAPRRDEGTDERLRGDG